MKAWCIDRFGPPEILQLRDMPDPVPGPDEVLVEVRAAGVNPGDLKVRNGTSPQARGAVFPHILGRDFSGVIAAVGANAAGLAPGDAVFGVLARGKEGAYAERVAVAARLVAAKPAALSHDEAAALALTGLTAIVALEDVAQLAAGQKILVQGGAGGVGGFAVQLARHLGAQVTATARPANHDHVRGLGAATVIDPAALDDSAGGQDIVFDTVGGDLLARSAALLKPGGLLVHVVAGPAGPRADIRVIRPEVGRDRRYMERIGALVAAGAVRPPRLQALDFYADAPRAHALVEAGNVGAKLVLSRGG